MKKVSILAALLVAALLAVPAFAETDYTVKRSLEQLWVRFNRLSASFAAVSGSVATATADIAGIESMLTNTVTASFVLVDGDTGETNVFYFDNGLLVPPSPSPF